MPSITLRRLLPAAACAISSTLIHAADAKPPEDPGAALDRALLGLDGPPSPSAPAPRADQPIAQIGAGGGTVLKLADISLDVLTVGGGSTATDGELANLQGGDHDPKRRGFTLQQAEVSLFGAVDPYFNAEAHIVFKEDGVELEEAYGTTTQLPADLQLKVGYYLTEFGRTNPQHPHQWPWLDQPVVITRIFGPDGNRGVGARVSWLTPLPWFSELLIGMQNPDDATEVSFLGGEHEAGAPPSGIGGRPAVARSTHSLADFLYAARWVNNWELPGATMLQLGLSGAAGPNSSGPDGDTVVVGADLLLKWHQASRAYPSVAWQSEAVARRYRADQAVDALSAAAIPAGTLRDWGATSQIVIGLSARWVVGVRGDYATGSGDSYVIGTGFVDPSTDPFRDRRWRVSPLVTFNPTEFSKLRLEYSYDHAQHLADRDAHSVWLGLELLIGAHPAHNY